MAAQRKAVSKQTAALMLTNPNTLGLFEDEILEIAEIVHGVGGLLYYDGANLNGILGKTRPGDMGFDIVHFNLHKTFATPHGGGGPGAGPVGVMRRLEKFLPVPVVEFDPKRKRYYLDYDRPHSVGKIKGFYGNFGVLVKAYTYIMQMGAQGLREGTEAGPTRPRLPPDLKAQFDGHGADGTSNPAARRPCSSVESHARTPSSEKRHSSPNRRPGRSPASTRRRTASTSTRSRCASSFVSSIVI